MYKSINTLASILVGLSLCNVESIYSLAAVKSDYENLANNDNSIVNSTSNSVDATCSSFREPDTFASKCCGNRYFKKGDRQTRAVGSKEASSTEYPWVVLLEYPASFVCSGFLISNIYVLTTAHCIVETLTRPTSVRLGHHGDTPEVICTDSKDGRTCNDGAISVPIEYITVHSNYSNMDSWKNDIAIIKLKEIVHFSEYIQPLCLPTFEVTEESVPGVLFEFAGWGTTFQTELSLMGNTYYTHPNSGKYFTKLENMPYKSNDVCQKILDAKLERNFTIHDTHICAGGVEGEGPCSGDSGGPLMFQKDNRYMAVGIGSVSVLSPCAYQDVPTVFTNIYKYDHWIREHTRENNNVILEVNT